MLPKHVKQPEWRVLAQELHLSSLKKSMEMFAKLCMIEKLLQIAFCPLALSRIMATICIPDAHCQAQIFLCDCDPVCVYGTKVGVFKDMHHVGLGRLLQRKECRRLPTFLAPCRVTVVLSSELPHQPCKRHFFNERVCPLLKLADLT